MAIAGFIVLGDRTSHGGVVISGDPQHTVDGRPVARLGDLATCPRCGRLTHIVSSRYPTPDEGNPPAYHLDMLECGAVLYSRYNDQCGWDGASEADLLPPPQQMIDRPLPLFHSHFVLRNSRSGTPLPGLRYRIVTTDNGAVSGITDHLGRTSAVTTASPLPIDIHLVDDMENVGMASDAPTDMAD
ncbi:PAAR domain-containing protein [Chitiniphilus eburneus]|nr:PAAR domain-containing protein [Chitiniphilus eburneus]